MKILHVLEPSGMGGVEKIVSELIDNSNDDIEVLLALPKKYIKDFKETFNIKKYENLIEMDFDSESKVNIKRYLEYKRILKNIEPDIIHTHSRKVCIFISMFNNKSKHIRTQHMEDKNISMLDKVLLKRKVDLWIATSKVLRENYLKKEYGSVGSYKYIYNGIKLANNKKIYKDNINNINLGFIGRLNKQKGLDLIIPILAEVKSENLFFHIIGEGLEEDYLREMTKDYNMDKNIIFYGKTNNVYDELIKLDCLLLPSRHEGLPLIVLESMACGIPVIANNVGAISEVIDNFENGFLVENKDEWLKILNSILDNNIKFNEIGKNAIETIEIKFNLEKMCNEYYETYKTMQ